MSATMEASTFARYFSVSPPKGRLGAAPTPCTAIDIPGRTFPVTEVFMEQLMLLGDLPFMMPKKADLFPDGAEGAPELSRWDDGCYFMDAYAES